MAKTFNRIPSISSTPSNSDLKSYNFTQANWKGVISDKNFLEVDQESFSDAKNVYVDKEGLLRSRPCCKIKNVVINGKTLENISDVFVFGDVFVYETIASNTKKLIFYNVKNTLNYSITLNTTTEYQLIYANNKIYIFTNDFLKAYDVSTNRITDESSSIYLPVTKVISGNETKDLESPNELTTGRVERYLFSSNTDVNYDKLISKQVNVKIGEDSYNLAFKKDTPKTFVEKKISLTENNFIYKHSIKVPLISTSDKNTVILCTHYSDRYDVYYSIDADNFVKIPSVNIDNTLKSPIEEPKISKDGNYAYYLGADDIYIYSLVNTGIPSQYFQEWTPLLSTLYSDCETRWLKTNASCIMDSINNFVVYHRVPVVPTKATCYSRKLLICNNNEIKQVIISNPVAAFNDNYAYHQLYYTEGDTVTENAILVVNYRQETANYLCELKNAKITNFNGESCKVTGMLTLSIYNDYDESTIKEATNVDITLSVNEGKYYLNDKVYIELVKTDVEGYYNLVLRPLVDYDSLNTIGPLSQDLYYDKNVNIKTNFTADKTSILVDAGAIYLVELGEETKVSNLYYNIKENGNAICNGLYWSNDVIKYSKHLNTNTLREFIYTTADKITVSKDYSYSQSKYDNFNIYSSDGTLINNQKLYADETISLLFDCIPISYNGLFFACTDTHLYASNLTSVIEINVVINGEYKFIKPDVVLKSSQYYFSKDKNLYISSKGEASEFKWYFPKINTQIYDFEITNLHRISSTEVAVFTEEGVYYIQKSEDGYLYYKSNIPVGCKKGNDIITTFDGKYTIFATNRGLVAMTYQQFVATEEQSLIYITDNVYTKYNNFYNDAIKLYKYLHWIVCYKKNHSDVMLYDLRTSSWWFMDSVFNFNNILDYDNDVTLLLNNKLYYPDTSDVRYYDYDGFNKYDVEWNISSQILHFNSVNYVKNLRDVTIISLLDSNKRLNFNLQMYYYRKIINESKEYLMSYKVDAIRTFVKHLNAMKVNQAKYIISYDAEAYEKLPLSISSLNIEYKITRQVR